MPTHIKEVGVGKYGLKAWLQSSLRGGISSSLVMPVVPGVNVPTGLPPCPGLRGEPCRDYQPYTNKPAKRR